MVRYRLPDLTRSWIATSPGQRGYHLEPNEVLGPHPRRVPVGGWQSWPAGAARPPRSRTISSSSTPSCATLPNAPGQWVEWVDRYMPGPGRGRGARRRPRRHRPSSAEAKLAESETPISRPGRRVDRRHFTSSRAVSPFRLHRPDRREHPRLPTSFFLDDLTSSCAALPTKAEH